MQPYLTEMRLLKRYNKGSYLFDAPTKTGSRAGMPAVQWPVYVYTDVPADAAAAPDIAVEQTPLHSLHNAVLCSVELQSDCADHVLSTDKHLTMLFEGLILHQRLPATILLDSGASTNFVHPKLVQQLRMHMQPASASLRLADNTEAPILGKVKLRLRMQGFSAAIPCYVTTLCEDFDVILGNTFLTGHNAVLDYGRNRVTLTRDGKRYSLLARTQTDATPFTGKPFLSCAQASRCVRNGCESYLVMVNSVLAASLTDTDSTDNTDVTDKLINRLVTLHR